MYENLLVFENDSIDIDGRGVVMSANFVILITNSLSL
jgi:hypothetical protein